MSSSGEAPILLTDDVNQLGKKIMKHAYSGGKTTIEQHRKGGNLAFRCFISISTIFL